MLFIQIKKAVSSLNAPGSLVSFQLHQNNTENGENEIKLLLILMVARVNAGIWANLGNYWCVLRWHKRVGMSFSSLLLFLHPFIPTCSLHPINNVGSVIGQWSEMPLCNTSHTTLTKFTVPLINLTRLADTPVLSYCGLVDNVSYRPLPFIVHLQTGFTLWQLSAQGLPALHFSLKLSLQPDVFLPHVSFLLDVLCTLLCVWEGGHRTNYISCTTQAHILAIV